MVDSQTKDTQRWMEKESEAWRSRVMNGLEYLKRDSVISEQESVKLLKDEW